MRERERAELVIWPKDVSPPPPLPFYREVGEEFPFMPSSEVCIYRNTTVAINRPLVGLVFIKIPLKATNSPQYYFVCPRLSVHHYKS